MKRIYTVFITFLLAVMTAGAVSDRTVVMISLDGFRWDYTSWYDTPFFDQMAKQGVQSGLIPSFPSKTFPNHYTLATGLYPDNHGIIANTFLDKERNVVFSISDPKTKSLARYWGGEPVWLTAKHQGVRTAVFYWPGSDVAIKGEHPDMYHVYDSDDRLSMEQRVDSMLSVMRLPDGKRPQLLMGYMEEPDHNGHTYCPNSKEARQAVEQMDALMKRLYDGMMSLPYAESIDFIVVSDHGMAVVTPDRQITVMDKLKKEWVARVEGSLPAHIYAKEGCQDSIYKALKGLDHLRVWKKGEVPEILHYGNNNLCGDVIAAPDLGFIFTDWKVVEGGQHGYDPYYSDMHALFRAVGPDFRNVKREHFKNVNVYSIVCHLLGIKPARNDGNLEEMRDILK